MCTPCEQKKQRLQFILDAKRNRARQWAKDQGLKEVVVFLPASEDGDDNDVYSFGATAPEGARDVEYLSVAP